MDFMGFSEFMGGGFNDIYTLMDFEGIEEDNFIWGEGFLEILVYGETFLGGWFWGTPGGVEEGEGVVGQVSPIYNSSSSSSAI